MNPMTKVIAAMRMAHRAHLGQTRKYTGEPYIVHPMAVAHLVADATGNPDLVIGALLHDTLEDTTLSAETIRITFGDHILGIVTALTEVYTREAYPEHNRLSRKSMEAIRLGKCSPGVKTIKLADLIDNTTSIVAHDPGFAKVYLAEKAALLNFLVGGDEQLHAWATRMVLEGKLSLGMN